MNWPKNSEKYHNNKAEHAEVKFVLTCMDKNNWNTWMYLLHECSVDFISITQLPNLGVKTLMYIV